MIGTLFLFASSRTFSFSLRLPAESSMALNAARGQLQLLNGSGILNTLGPAVEKLDVPPVILGLISKVEAARDAFSLVPQADLDAASQYLGVVSGALKATDAPLATNTGDGAIFVAEGDEVSYMRFDVSRPAAISALRFGLLSLFLPPCSLESDRLHCSDCL